MNNKLAIDGGTPVRTKPFPLPYPGTYAYGEEEKNAVLDVLSRKSPFRYYGMDVAGKTKEFEKSFLERMDKKYALAVTSGTASLICGLKAAGIGPGDKVILPAITFLASAGAIIIAGAVPVFADVDDSFNMLPSEISRLADKYTKAVMTVPLLGNPCNMNEIMIEARKNNLIVIEDVAQSMGSKYKGKYSGTFGDIGCFSLQLNKIITTGDGGILTTDNSVFYERAVRYHDQGMFREKEGFLSSDNVNDVFVGQNYRMSEITGAIAQQQFLKLDNIIEHMRKIKGFVKSQISDLPQIGFRRIEDEEGECGSALVLLLENKEISKKFCDAIRAEGVPMFPQYNGQVVYMMPHILNQKTVDSNGFPFNQIPEKIEYYKGMCPNAENLLGRSASITFSYGCTIEDAKDVVNAIKKVAKALC
jgi:8-amino-3,8-dideoxy-alpha-D-manno-octulosonate transaminase